MEKILDLHIHSKYSRSCSPDLELPKIAAMCVKKGIDIVVTSDFTHPRWFEHIKENLEEVGNSGLFRLKKQPGFVESTPGKARFTESTPGKARFVESTPGKARFTESTPGESSQIRFVLGTEISCIYKHKEKTRRVHLLIYAPSFEAVEKINAEFDKRGLNRRSDGRPMIGLQAKELLALILRADKSCFMIPAHAWTPWYAIFGSKSGYDSLQECFEEFTPQIRAIETGLSSDPIMNHCLSNLDNITLVSNSDAHSLEKLGREANIFSFSKESDITYNEIKKIISTGDKKKFLYTIEFYPEEGKYHYDGHADCKVCLSSIQSKKEKGLCPKCKKPLIIGVESRINELADRKKEKIPTEKFIPHKYIVPLTEILAQIIGVNNKSKKVLIEYEKLIQNIGSEFYILIKANKEEVLENTNYPKLWLAIENIRKGKVKLQPGYDGVFGKVTLT